AVKINDGQTPRIFFDRQRNLRRQHVVRVKSGRNILQSDETFHEQAGADQQNKRENGFGNDQSVAQAIMMSAASRAPSTFFQRFGQFGFRTDDRGHEAEKNSRS